MRILAQHEPRLRTPKSALKAKLSLEAPNIKTQWIDPQRRHHGVESMLILLVLQMILPT